jgi:hypothetical protein
MTQTDELQASCALDCIGVGYWFMHLMVPKRQQNKQLGILNYLVE